MPRSEASLDDISSDTSYDADEDYRLAQQEWEESLQQLHQLLTVVLMPFLGKWLGRRWSYWGQPSLCNLLPLFLTSASKAYARYLQLGLGKSFFWTQATGA
jgi:Mitochondrial import 2